MEFELPEEVKDKALKSWNLATTIFKWTALGILVLHRTILINPKDDQADQMLFLKAQSLTDQDNTLLRTEYGLNLGSSRFFQPEPQKTSLDSLINEIDAVRRRKDKTIVKSKDKDLKICI